MHKEPSSNTCNIHMIGISTSVQFMMCSIYTISRIDLLNYEHNNNKTVGLLFSHYMIRRLLMFHSADRHIDHSYQT